MAMKKRMTPAQSMPEPLGWKSQKDSRGDRLMKRLGWSRVPDTSSVIPPDSEEGRTLAAILNKRTLAKVTRGELIIGQIKSMSVRSKRDRERIRRTELALRSGLKDPQGALILDRAHGDRDEFGLPVTVIDETVSVPLAEL